MSAQANHLEIVTAAELADMIFPPVSYSRWLYRRRAHHHRRQAQDW